jgi:uncharacterized protein (DUF169 family)
MKFCIRCGRKLATDASYCDGCGAPTNRTQWTTIGRASRGSQNRDIEQAIKSVLNLEGWPVAVKLLKDSSESPSDVEEIDEAHRHCEMIQEARLHGISFSAPLSKQRCKVAAISLGLMKQTEELRKHQVEELFKTRHRFKTEELLWRFLESTPKVLGKHTSILYGPLGSIPIDPDVVVLVCDPLQAMKIIQAYQYTMGQRASVSVGGLFALCADAVATPYSSGSINIALGCEGARKHAGLKDYELSVGFSYRMAGALTDALHTLAEYEGVEEKHA